MEESRAGSRQSRHRTSLEAVAGAFKHKKASFPLGSTGENDLSWSMPHLLWPFQHLLGPNVAAEDTISLLSNWEPTCEGQWFREQSNLES